MKLLCQLSFFVFLCISIKTLANGKSVGISIPNVETLSSLTTSVEELTGIPSDFKLYQNYPNPFNPKTKIKYKVPEVSDVCLKVFDVLGNEISTLVSNKQPVGFYEIEFNTSSVLSGIYIYKVIAGNYVNTKKMILLR